MKKGVLLIVCGPSGVGKTSLSRRLLERHDSLEFSTSYTTREPRPEETDGEAYHFVDKSTFEQMRDDGKFAEWAKVHGNFYGTSIEVIRSAWRHDRDVIFDIDYQGAKQLKDRFPHATAVLVVPPTMATLEQRLAGRGSDSEEVIERRLDAARFEISQYELFDYIVENDEFEEAAATMQSIYTAARQQRVLKSEAVERLLAE